MFVLLTYDIDLSDGGKTLRKVAKTCEDYGVRVQNSVFELDIDSAGLVKLKNVLGDIIDPSLDSIRKYKLGKMKKADVEIIGKREVVEISSDNGLFL